MDKPVLVPAALVNETAVANAPCYCWEPGSSSSPPTRKYHTERPPSPSLTAPPRPPPFSQGCSRGQCLQLGLPVPGVLLGRLYPAYHAPQSPSHPRPLPIPLPDFARIGAEAAHRESQGGGCPPEEGRDCKASTQLDLRPASPPANLQIGARQRIERGPLGPG